MNVWFDKVTADENDFGPVIEAIIYFESEATEAKKEVRLHGSVARASQMIPGIVEHRYSQLQEIEAILKYLEIRHAKVKGDAYRMYLTAYNRVLTSRDADKFADGDKDVIEMMTLINRVAYVRNLYLGIMKGLDSKQFQINNLVKLRVSGFEDFELS